MFKNACDGAAESFITSAMKRMATETGVVDTTDKLVDKKRAESANSALGVCIVCRKVLSGFPIGQAFNSCRDIVVGVKLRIGSSTSQRPPILGIDVESQ